jgi:hypothetical protein
MYWSVNRGPDIVIKLVFGDLSAMSRTGQHSIPYLEHTLGIFSDLPQKWGGHQLALLWLFQACIVIPNQIYSKFLTHILGSTLLQLPVTLVYANRSQWNQGEEGTIE